METHLKECLRIARRINNLLFRLEHDPFNPQKFEEVFNFRKQFDEELTKAYHAGELGKEEEGKFHNFRLLPKEKVNV